MGGIKNTMHSLAHGLWATLSATLMPIWYFNNFLKTSTGFTFHLDDDGNSITCNKDFDPVCKMIFQPDTFQDLKSKVMKMKRHCGSVCDTGITSTIMGQYYPQVWKNIDCPAMFQDPLFERPSEFSFPLGLQYLPEYLKREFSYNQQVKLTPAYVNNTHSNARFM